MRRIPLLSSALMALALAGCMHQQQTYYVVDPATGQPVPVVQQYQQPQYGQQGYAPPAYQQPAPQYADNSRGLFSSSPAAAQQSYTAQAYGQPTYAPQPQYTTQPARPPAARPASSGRGLFTSSRSATPAYAPQVYPQQTYPQETYAAPPTYAPQPQYAPQPRYAVPRIAAPAQSYAYASPAAGQTAYTLDSGDKLRVVVFGQDGITNSYVVGADGNVSLPLVGAVPARGFTTAQLSKMISERLKQGYVREPHVSVEIETYRPFFILGEVRNAGQYPYVSGMTVETAVAIGGGYTERASEQTFRVTRKVDGVVQQIEAPSDLPLRPGDTVYVFERYF